MKRYLPLLLLVAGFLLVAAVAFLLLHGSLRAAAPIDVPPAVAGYALSEQTGGAEAIAEIQNLHLGDFAMQDASVAVYGAQNVIIWTAEAGSEANAQSLMIAMDNAIINATDIPFSMMGMYIFSGRQVRSLDGLGQLHFYFQSGSKVVWVSSDFGAAEIALQDAMAFYP